MRPPGTEDGFVHGPGNATPAVADCLARGPRASCGLNMAATVRQPGVPHKNKPLGLWCVEKEVWPGAHPTELCQVLGATGREPVWDCHGRRFPLGPAL